MVAPASASRATSSPMTAAPEVSTKPHLVGRMVCGWLGGCACGWMAGLWVVGWVRLWVVGWVHLWVDGRFVVPSSTLSELASGSQYIYFMYKGPCAGNEYKTTIYKGRGWMGALWVGGWVGRCLYSGCVNSCYCLHRHRNLLLQAGVLRHQGPLCRK